MTEGGMPAPQSAGNNSSDFVRKLYKMLGDPQYNNIVRWGNEGLSFVVIDNEKFTKTILPKHFKHSNFASFVRQLNKYDFHKVRHNEETGQSPYGAGAWEFKHPEFRADRKDNLDNIRRKAPSAKGKMAGDETNLPMAQQITLLNEQVTATQQQVQELQESYAELSQTNKLFIAEIMNLQKMVRAQGQVQREILNYLDDRRRNVQLAPAPAFNTQGVNMLTDSADDVAELRRAREIMNGIPLSDMSAAERELERLLAAYQTASPPDSVGSSAMFGAAPHHGGGGGPPHQHHGGPSGPGPVTLGLPHDPINDMRHLVYPVGQNNGIDPFHPDHIAHIPYSRPIANPTPLATDGPNAGGQLMAGPSRSQQQQRSAPHWATRKPRVLLVEDDAVCSKIGAKFLTQMDCIVEVARDGLDGITKANKEHGAEFDLIFMDIIMPQLDGVSATAWIREIHQRVPIIAMTSNIRQEDIETYYQYGMNDVLAKPFTKDGMERILRKHLAFLIAQPNMAGGPQGSSASPTPTPTSASRTLPPLPPQPGQGSSGPSAPSFSPASASSAAASSSTGGVGAGGGPLGPPTQTPPLQSPATSGSWHSPSQPVAPLLPPPSGLAPPPPPQQPGGLTSPSLGVKMEGGPMGTGYMATAMGDRPEKRQRLFGSGPAGGAYAQ